ncbi:sugar transferase [Salisediminibacterium halotolerans]|nr:sugar transferase [Salisediminibacterium halotolerans]
MADFLFALLFVILLAPLFVIVALMLKIDSRGPVIFKQSRLGYKGDVFNVWKFRTMCDDAENQGTGLTTAENDPRITKIGSLLRKASLDELPQLFNILKGDMSFIGPRPAPAKHLKEYSHYEMQRLDILPGITGWSQVNGRNFLTWAERIPLDIWYMRNVSLKIDLLIILKTIKVLVLSEGVYSGRNDKEVQDANKKE